MTPVPSGSLPPVVERRDWQRELDELLVKEKAHTREGDALAAARRRLPMVAIPPNARIEGEHGRVSLLEAFEGRRMLIAYFHMWHDGQPWEQQCEGCTFCAWQIQRPEYLHARDITLAIFSEGTYAESRPYADFLGHRLPWYSARGEKDLVCGRAFGFLAFYVRDDDGNVFETYWTSGRGTEPALWPYGLMDRTVFGRHERWEDSPTGWPRLAEGIHPWRVGGRPIAQWSVTSDQIEGEHGCHCAE